MTRVPELTPLVKRLQLGPMAATLPERIALARGEHVDYASFLEIILADEISRRENRRIELRLHSAGFEETCRPRGLRLVGVHHPGPPPAGRRLLSGVPRQARACAAGGTRRSGQELPGPGPGLLHRPHHPLQPCRRLLQDHGPGKSRQLTGPHPPAPSCPPTCSSWTTWACTASLPSSRRTCTS